MRCNAYFGSGAIDGSWVEHATNISHLPDFDFATHLRPFEDRRLPSELQGPLLHEMTHHWCFDSPVGWALSLLRFRLLGNTIQSAGGPLPFEANRELWMDIARYEVAIELMRPITEGLALFVEHDAVAAGEFTFSAPLTSLFELFQGHLLELFRNRGAIPEEADLAALVPRAMATLLKLGRTIPAAVERKADLLASPIDAERPAGHYLIGYLTLRYIWSRMRGRVYRPHNNSDAFASYVRAYIFHDWGLVAAILDDCEDERVLGNRIGGYLRDRLLWLLDGPIGELDAAIEAWDSAVDAGRPLGAITLLDDGATHLDGLDEVIPGINPDRRAAGGPRLLEKTMAWFNYFKDPLPEIRAVKQWSLRRFVTRGLMPIVQESGVIVAEEGEPARFVTAAGKPVMAFEPFQPLPAGTHEAAAELMFSMTAMESVLLIFHGGKLVGGKIPDRFEFLRDSDDFSPSFASAAEIETLELWEARHGQVMRDTERVYSILYKQIAASMPMAISKLYLHYVAGMLRQEDATAMAAKMKETGLLPYLDKDFGLLRSLARLGATAGSGERMGRVNADFAKAGEDLRLTLDRLEKVRARTGLRTFLEHEGVVIPMV